MTDLAVTANDAATAQCTCCATTISVCASASRHHCRRWTRLDDTVILRRLSGRANPAPGVLKALVLDPEIVNRQNRAMLEEKEAPVRLAAALYSKLAG